jgi:hypothetical protein
VVGALGREPLAAREAEIGLRGRKMIPVGCEFGALGMNIASG